MKLFENPIALIVIIIICMMIFGIGKVPEVGASLGKTMRSFNDGFKSDEKIDIEKLLKGGAEPRNDAALAIAKKRFDEGKITKEEYDELVKDLS